MRAISAWALLSLALLFAEDEYIHLALNLSLRILTILFQNQLCKTEFKISTHHSGGTGFAQLSLPLR